MLTDRFVKGYGNTVFFLLVEVTVKPLLIFFAICFVSEILKNK